MYVGLKCKIGRITDRLEYNLSNEAAKVPINMTGLTFRGKDIFLL
jgi:hypothetical protein